MAAALLATLQRPGAWATALAAFLVRGGIVPLLVPILVIPSTSGLAIIVGPSLVAFVFGQTAPEFVLLVVIAIVLVGSWILFGGLVGAWLDLALLRDTAADEELEVAAIDRGGLPWAGLAARLLALLPLAVALSWGAYRIAEATYQQLILPDDLAIPTPLRVLRDVPDAVLLVAATWLLGEAVGGLAQRRLAVAPASVPAALGWAVGRFVRAPLGTLGTLALTNVVAIATVVTVALATGVAWDRLRIALVSTDGAGSAVGLALFLATWLLALALTGFVVAWRATAWTFEAYRHEDAVALRDASSDEGSGTIGEAARGRPGEWPTPDASGRL